MLDVGMMGFGRSGISQTSYFDKSISGQGGYWGTILTGDYVWDGGSLQELILHHLETVTVLQLLFLAIPGFKPTYTIHACIPYS